MLIMAELNLNFIRLFCTSTIHVFKQGHTQDFLQGVSTDSRSQTRGSGAQSSDADKLFIFVMSPCSVF